MVAFEVHGDPHEVIARVRLITPAVSLGSVDTLIQHPASISHRIVDTVDRHGAGVISRTRAITSCGSPCTSKATIAPPSFG
ncbi:PLP-dependent transferase [Streptomyces recifensis]|uniref:PLP-dependent transferase n=1 Tax=Streptomyces recifensis TaxID=67355 RepID=UPI001FCA065E|nr:PLP-dependent transferase [Streptomyces recifensis]